MARLYTRIYTHLNTNWETGVIAKPTFFDMDFQDYNPPNALGIWTTLGPNFQHPVADETEIGRTWPFQLHLYATSDANLELMIEQCLERLADYSATNQRWRATGVPFLDPRNGVKHAQISCEEFTTVEVESY